MTKQPRWKRIANLGDVNPIEYGGFFVYVDQTGIYPPEVELLEVPDDDAGVTGWRIYRFSLDRCTFEDGILSDNRFHPGIRSWFADSLASIAATVGRSELELINDLCGDDPIARAFAYQDIGSYHGFDNLDSYPQTYSKRSELPRRIRRYSK